MSSDVEKLMARNEQAGRPAGALSAFRLEAWMQAWLVLGVVLVGATVRMAYLGEVSLWFDESFCWKMSTYPLSEQWARATGDNHPPLYYFLLKPWTVALGNSPWASRLLSVVCGLAAIVGTYFLVRDIEASALSIERGDGRTVWPALLAAALVALSPFQIEWSQTVRMYALGVPLAVWSTWALLRAMREGATWRAWLLYALLAASLIYSHYFGLFILAAHGIYGAVAEGRRALATRGWSPSRLQGPALAVCVVALLWWPWMDEFLLQRRRGIEQEWGRPTGIEHLLRSIAEMFGLMWAPATGDLTMPWIITSLLGAVSLATVLAGRGAERLLGLCVVSTFGLALLIASGSKSLVASWYFLFAHAFVLCAMAVWACRWPWRFARHISTGLLLIVAVWQGWEQVEWRRARAERPSFQDALAYVESQRDGEDPIYVNGPRDWVAASPYVERPGTLFVLSPRTDFRFGEGTAVLNPEDYATAASVASFPASRAWAVFATNGSHQPIAVDMPPEWIPVSEERFHDWRYSEILVREYVRSRAVASPISQAREPSAAP